MTPFGLTERAYEYLTTFFKQRPDIHNVSIFGSRAMGNFKHGSDIDIAISGPLSESDAQRINIQLNEHSPLPYFFDIVHYDHLENAELKNHIDTHAKPLYPQ